MLIGIHVFVIVIKADVKNYRENRNNTQRLYDKIDTCIFLPLNSLFI